MSYSRSSSPFDQARSYVQRSGIPVTIGLAVVSLVLFLTNFFSGDAVLRWFAFVAPPIHFIDAYKAFTYPLSDTRGDYINVVFGCLWLYSIGGSLERGWGSARFAGFFFAMALVMSLSLWVGCLVLHTDHVMYGLWLPLACLTVAWATLNPTMKTLFMFVLQIEARWIALFVVGLIYFVDFGNNWILGLFALLGPLAAWLTVRQGWVNHVSLGSSRRPTLRMTNSPGAYRPLDDAAPSTRFNPLAWYRNWQQQRRLKKLLQDSGFSGKEDERRR